MQPERFSSSTRPELDGLAFRLETDVALLQHRAVLLDRRIEAVGYAAANHRTLILEDHLAADPMPHMLGAQNLELNGAHSSLP